MAIPAAIVEKPFVLGVGRLLILDRVAGNAIAFPHLNALVMPLTTEQNRDGNHKRKLKQANDCTAWGDQSHR